MIQFHSTLAYLADPPQSYQQPAVDLVSGLSQLQRDIDNNVFRNEYAFEAALNHLIHAAHDDHLELVGGALSRFTYAAPYRIVSVSSDGVELPKVYISGRYTGRFKIAVADISIFQMICSPTKRDTFLDSRRLSEPSTARMSLST